MGEYCSEKDEYVTLSSLQQARLVPVFPTCYHLIPEHDSQYASRHGIIPLFPRRHSVDTVSKYIAFSPEWDSHIEWAPERIRTMGILIGGSYIPISIDDIDPLNIEMVQVHDCSYSPMHPEISPQIHSFRSVPCLNIHRIIPNTNSTNCCAHLRIYMKPHQVPLSSVYFQYQPTQWTHIFLKSKLICCRTTTPHKVNVSEYPREHIERMVDKVKKHFLERLYRFRELRILLSSYISDDIIQHLLFPILGSYPHSFFPIQRIKT